MYYTVRRWPGVAVRVVGYPKVWESYIGIDTDEDDNEFEYETGDGEWIEQDESCGRVIVCMVGDDENHEIDLDDLVEIKNDEFCRDCGQVGCCQNVYE